jgi:hypothetical protein
VPEEWKTPVRLLAIVLTVLAVVLWAEGPRGQTTIQNVTNKVGDIAGGAQTKFIGFININRQTFGGDGTQTPAWTEKRKGSSGRRKTDQVPPDPNKRIGYVRVRDDDIQLFDQASGQYLFTVVQVWFRNESQTPVTELSAQILVTDDHEDYWTSHHGRWAIGTKAENVGGWTETKIKVDLAPGELGKLNAFVKGPGALPNRCRFYVEKDDGSPDWEIWGSDRAVRLQLHAGGGIDRTFQFRLVNDDGTFALLVR